MNNNRSLVYKEPGCRLCADDWSVRHTASQQKKRFFQKTARWWWQCNDKISCSTGPPQKFKKALNVADKIRCRECIIWLHAPYALLGAEVVWNAAQLCCIFTHYSQDFQCSRSDNVYIEQSLEHSRLWASCGTDTALTDLMPSRSANSSPHRWPGGDNTAIT